MKFNTILKTKLTKFAPGGQAIGDVSLSDGVVKKAFVWGGLPGEEVEFKLTKSRAGIYEGIVDSVENKSEHRIKPREPVAYLSTSPWQILEYDYELLQKSELTQQAFSQHQVTIPLPEVITDYKQYNYRNKMEFTWWWDNATSKVELANYRRGTKGKIPVAASILATEPINQAAQAIRNLINAKQIEARGLKTLLVRSTQAGEVVAQLYTMDEQISFSVDEVAELGIKGFEVIYSNPKSPASVITKRLQKFGDVNLNDYIFDLNFNYPAESFFQINLPVYKLAIEEIKSYLDGRPIIDLYSGVGSIGLSVASGQELKMIEINQEAVDEMKRNIENLNYNNAVAVLSPAEDATEYINKDAQLIVDPPRAGMHKDVVAKILSVCPKKIIYLSCNPATQARDIKLLLAEYELKTVKVFNFFPRTPHIESLAVLNKR